MPLSKLYFRDSTFSYVSTFSIGLYIPKNKFEILKSFCWYTKLNRQLQCIYSYTLKKARRMVTEIDNYTLKHSVILQLVYIVWKTVICTKSYSNVPPFFYLFTQIRLFRTESLNFEKFRYFSGYLNAFSYCIHVSQELF